MRRTAREHDLSLAVPDDGECGEAMRLLTSPQRAFVCALLEGGGQDHALAAMRAGYGGHKDAAQVMASRMMRNPKIIASIREEADRRLQAGAVLASSALIEIAKDMRHKDRFKASVELLNRAGLLVETRQRITIEDNRDTEQLKADVENMLRKAFAQPKPLALTQPVVDAEFYDPNDISDLMCEV